jgi:hypothetical protein
MNYKLLSVSSDAKTRKGEKHGYLTGILYLAPHTLAGGRTLCPFSTPGCRRVCLYTAGHGAFSPVQNARVRKSQEYLRDTEGFVWDLHEDIGKLCDEAKKKRMTPAVRLNGTSDIEWERYRIMENFSDIQFYDYTKFPPNLRQMAPENYHLTYSFSEARKSRDWADGWFERGFNTSAVFFGELPTTFLDRPVINGDESDLRFTDPKGVVVGLKVKGKARHDDGDGFVQKAVA